MRRFDPSLCRDRSFSCYDNCPEIYYRFNSKGEYGPRKLDAIVSFFSSRSEELIEGRFADEEEWKSIKYFLALWEDIPAGSHTLKRLEREAIDPHGLTEASARQVLRERQQSKPPTAREIEYLRTVGITVTPELRRGDAQKLVREHERTVGEEQRRHEEAPEVESYAKRLGELKSQIQHLVPDWTPKHFEDAVSYMCYVSLIEDALDHAKYYDLTQLQSDLFYDGLHIDVAYYLEFTRDPTAHEIRGFQAALFCAYLAAESESFDHLAILRDTLPMIRASSVNLDE